MNDPTPYSAPDGRMIIKTDAVVSPPDGWEWTDTHLAEIRPARQPDPIGVTIDLADLSDTLFHTEVWITTVGEMRGRSDLDQWEYADNDPQSIGWTRFSHMAWKGTPDGFPVIVCRKGGGS